MNTIKLLSDPNSSSLLDALDNKSCPSVPSHMQRSNMVNPYVYNSWCWPNANAPSLSQPTLTSWFQIKKHSSSGQHSLTSIPPNIMPTQSLSQTRSFVKNALCCTTNHIQQLIHLDHTNDHRGDKPSTSPNSFWILKNPSPSLRITISGKVLLMQLINLILIYCSFKKPIFDGNKIFVIMFVRSFKRHFAMSKWPFPPIWNQQQSILIFWGYFHHSIGMLLFPSCANQMWQFQYGMVVLHWIGWESWLMPHYS